MSRQWIPGLLGAGVLVVIGGCNEQQTVDASSGAPRMVAPAAELVAQARPPIPDLPVPLGFKLDQSRSRNFAAAGLRYVDHVYTGSADKFAVARFYKRQMPVNRWTLVTDMFVQGKVVLHMRKETETCQITITEGGVFSSTRIEVQLFTSGRIESPS